MFNYLRFQPPTKSFDEKYFSLTIHRWNESSKSFASFQRLVGYTPCRWSSLWQRLLSSGVQCSLPCLNQLINTNFILLEILSLCLFTKFDRKRFPAGWHFHSNFSKSNFWNFRKSLKNSKTFGKLGKAAGFALRVFWVRDLLL